MVDSKYSSTIRLKKFGAITTDAEMFKFVPDHLKT